MSLSQGQGTPTQSNNGRKGSKTSLVAGSPAVKHLCGHCKKSVTVECVECDICSHWFHFKCVGLNGGRGVGAFLELPGVHWYCSCCDRSQAQLSAMEGEIKAIRSIVVKSEEKVDSLQNLGAIDEKIKSLEEGLTKVADALSKSYTKLEHELKLKTDSVDSSTRTILESIDTLKNSGRSYSDVTKAIENSAIKVQEHLEKQTGSLINQIGVKEKMDKDTEFRAKNVVLFGVNEFESREGWTEQVDKIITDCHIDLKLDSRNSYRLGKYDPSKHTERPRPVRICTISETQMWELLSRINQLKLPGIFARRDLSKQEQEQDFRLRKELKETKIQNPTLKYKIKKGKITVIQ